MASLMVDGNIVKLLLAAGKINGYLKAGETEFSSSCWGMYPVDYLNFIKALNSHGEWHCVFS